MFIVPCMYQPGYKDTSNYLGYIFSKQARAMLTEIKEIADEDGRFKLETILTGGEKLRRQYVGNVRDIKGTMLNRIYSVNGNDLTEIDLADKHRFFTVIPYSKQEDKMPNRFLEQIRKADEKWALKNKN